MSVFSHRAHPNSSKPEAIECEPRVQHQQSNTTSSSDSDIYHEIADENVVNHTHTAAGGYTTINDRELAAVDQSNGFIEGHYFLPVTTTSADVLGQASDHQETSRL